MKSSLQVTAVKKKLSTKWLGQNYIFEEVVNSTNDSLKELLDVSPEETLATGTVFLTDFQEQGRGRLDRRWLAPAGTSLLFSVLLRPHWPAEKSFWLTMLASISIVETIRSQTTVNAAIKWPNDIVVLCEDTWHKVAGLLLETNLDAHGRCQSAVLGIGINVNIAAAQLPLGSTQPASLLSASGSHVPRLPFFIELLHRLETHYEAAVEDQSPQPAWQQRLITLGQPVTVTNAGTAATILGTAVATNEWGQLIVEAEDGRRHTILAGDVTLREKPFDNSTE